MSQAGIIDPVMALYISEMKEINNSVTNFINVNFFFNILDLETLPVSRRRGLYASWSILQRNSKKIM